ncbi:hypothetical protein C7444_10255 [Sphaerotilus hippei]|uniref:Fic/DOC family protein n=1 Tax=Sphaerotilus hippei TaxID=744406 RepID=A0A318H8Y6_9BURK|nr:hypothetical protein [Sphaerotilus hippei]PXW98578.1 hypothetical protein C7444_10255 [Sphaerotilus hippei]
MTDRYQVTGAEGEFEPGSNEQVLRNRVGIQSPDDMADLELGLLAQFYDEVLFDRFPDRQLLVQDLKSWHHLWLGNVYSWAGQERSVNMVKSGFMFAAAGQISRLLDEFEVRYLMRLGTSQARLHRSDSRRTFRPLRPDGPAGRRGHGRQRRRPQRASLMWAKRSEGWRSFCSS